MSADWRNDRIQKFDADGKPLKVFGTPGNGNGELHRPSGITLDDSGNLHIADWGNHRVQILDPEGRFSWLHSEAAPDCPNGPMTTSASIPTSWRSGRKQTWSLTLDPDTIYDTRDESASIEKYFWGPTAVRLDDDGRMFVVDSCRHRIQVYQREQTQGLVNHNYSGRFALNSIGHSESWCTMSFVIVVLRETFKPKCSTGIFSYFMSNSRMTE